MIDKAGTLRRIAAAIAGGVERGTDDAALASVLGALNNAAAEGAVTDVDTAMAYLKQQITLQIAADIVLANIHDTDLPAVIDDTEDIQTILGTPANFMADLSTLETRLSATRAGYLDEAISTPKAILSSDWKGNFSWVTASYTTSETDISTLFSTNLALTTRRKYSVKLDLTNVESDGSFDSCYIKVKEKIDGTNYRIIDKKTIEKADIASDAEPGIIIVIPATSENIQITMQMSVALAGNATIYYAVVKEHLE